MAKKINNQQKDLMSPTGLLPFQKPESTQTTTPAPKVDTTKDVVIHNSPAGANETVIYNSGTGKYRIQRKDPQGNNITEYALNSGDADKQTYSGVGEQLYRGSNDAEVRAVVTSAQNADMQAQQAQEPNITPEQKAQIGQLDPNVINSQDAIDADIQRKIAMRMYEQGKNPDGTPLTIRDDTLGNALNDATVRNFAGLPRLNQLTAFVGTLPGGTSIVNSLSNNREVREYLQDYSNADNLGRIRENIGKADIAISDAIEFAKNTENTPENNKIANRLYTEAISQKYKAIRQLTKIAENDQRAYSDSIQYDLADLELYFNGDKTRGIPARKIVDDNNFYVALNKPAPKYLPKNTG